MVVPPRKEVPPRGRALQEPGQAALSLESKQATLLLEMGQAPPSLEPRHKMLTVTDCTCALDFGVVGDFFCLIADYNLDHFTRIRVSFFDNPVGEEIVPLFRKCGCSCHEPRRWPLDPVTFGSLCVVGQKCV